MFRKIWVLLKPFHRAFFALILLAVIGEGAQIAVSYTVSLIVSLFTLKIQLMVWGLIVLAMLNFNELTMRLDNSFDWHIIAKQSHPIYRYLKLGAIAKFLRMDIAWHHHHNSGTLVGQVSDGVWKTLEIVDMLSWEFMPTIIQTVLSLIPLFWLTPYAAVLSLLAFSLFAYLTIRGEKEKRPFRQARQDLYQEEWSEAVQAVQGHEFVITSNQQDRALAVQEQLHDRIIGQAMKEHRLGIFKYNRWRIRILTSIRLIVYAIWVSQLYRGTLTVAGLIFVSVLTEKLFNSFWRFARLADRVYGSSEAVTRLIGLMDEPEPIETGTESAVIAGPVGISMKNVCFAYSDEYSEGDGALHDFSLEVEPGSIVALVGPSGAGKTTIRKIITKLSPFQSGAISIGGLDIARWNGKKLRDLFSTVPQSEEVYVFDKSIYENIAYPWPDAPEEKIIEAARLAGIHDFIKGLEKGYQTMVGERGVRLSGGQRQRLALARAILLDRPILFFDEPTSAVDAITEKEIQENLGMVLRGKTVIIIAHRLATVWHIANKIVVMKDGRKVEEGGHQQLVSAGGLYAEMVALQTVTGKTE